MNIDFKKYKRGSTLQTMGTVLKFFLQKKCCRIFLIQNNLLGLFGEVIMYISILRKMLKLSYLSMTGAIKSTLVQGRIPFLRIMIPQYLQIAEGMSKVLCYLFFLSDVPTLRRYSLKYFDMIYFRNCLKDLIPNVIKYKVIQIESAQQNSGCILSYPEKLLIRWNLFTFFKAEPERIFCRIRN